MTREEMLGRMSATEFIQWQILASIEPFGDTRSDIQTAMLAATISNMSGKTLRSKVEMKDFLIDYVKPKAPEQSVEEMHANFLRIFEFAKNKAAKGKPS